MTWITGIVEWTKALKAVKWLCEQFRKHWPKSKTAAGLPSDPGHGKPPSAEDRDLLQLAPGAIIIRVAGGVELALADAVQRFYGPQPPKSVLDQARSLMVDGVLQSEAHQAILRLHFAKETAITGRPEAKQKQDQQMAEEMIEVAKWAKVMIARGLDAAMKRRGGE